MQDDLCPCLNRAPVPWNGISLLITPRAPKVEFMILWPRPPHVDLTKKWYVLLRIANLNTENWETIYVKRIFHCGNVISHSRSETPQKFGPFQIHHLLDLDSEDDVSKSAQPMRCTQSFWTLIYRLSAMMCIIAQADRLHERSIGTKIKFLHTNIIRYNLSYLKWCVRWSFIDFIIYYSWGHLTLPHQAGFWKKFSFFYDHFWLDFIRNG